MSASSATTRWGERGSRLVLVAAVTAYAALALYLTRGATFTFDELTWLVDSDGFSPGSTLEPHYGHPIATTRLIFAGTLATVGPEEIVIRLSMIVAVAATAILLYALLRRRIGSVAALAPCIVVLFLGSTPEPLTVSVMPFPQTTTLGLGALVLLARRDRLGDGGACVLLIASVASLEIGLAFVAAAAVIVLLDAGASRRSWIFGVPALLFAAWWVWASQYDESLADASNILLIPSYAADSMAAAVSGLSGLGYEFTASEGSPLGLEWGRVLAPALVAAVVWRGWRHGCSRELLAFVAIAVVLWIGFGLGAGPFRTPDTGRYAYPVAIALVLILGEGFRGVGITRGVLLGLVAASLFALPGNLAGMRATGSQIRADSALVDAELAMIELQRGNVSPDFNAGLGVAGFRNLTTAGDYLGAVDRHGSIASSPAELTAAPAAVRNGADLVLREILEPRVEAGASIATARCARVPTDGLGAELPLPPGGVALRSTAPAELSLRRFGDSYEPIAGSIRPGALATVEIPVDSATQPWVASIATSGDVVACELEVGAS